MNHFPETTNTTEVQTELPLPNTNVSRSVEKSWSINALARRTVLAKFGALKGGRINVNNSGNTEFYGELDVDRLEATVAVFNQSFYRKLLVGGTIGSAESYIDNDWGSDNLTDLIRIMIRNMDSVTKMERRWSRVRSAFHRFRHLTRKNTVKGSRRNIHEHYDLGNEFYQLFLDPTLNYSAGIFNKSVSDQVFPEAESPMHAASLVKMRHICERLQLQPGQSVVEIGTGWGALAIYMAEHYGVHVTTTTISREQFNYAVELVKAKGLEGQVTVLQKDYR